MMGWLAVDKDGTESIFITKPIRNNTLYVDLEHTKYAEIWNTDDYEDIGIELPKGSIEKLIGRKLTWEDEPVELKEEA
jgi:hypothetical protein